MHFVVKHPEALSITSYPEWEFFGTLTYKGSVPRPDRARTRVFRYLRQTAKAAGKPFGEIVWVTRNEHGEKTGRYHHHFLLGKTGFALKSRSCFSLMKRWNWGNARVTVIDHRLSYANYVAKGDNRPEAGRFAEDWYELGKFSWTEDPPELSNSLKEWLRRTAVSDAAPYPGKKRAWMRPGGTSGKSAAGS